MTTEKEHGNARALTRRGVLQAGLAAAAMGAVGANNDVVAQVRTQGAGSGGVQVIDIHAHYLPESFLNVLNSEEGKRFGTEYRMTDQGFYYKTPLGASGPNPVSKYIDLKPRIADMDDQGVAIQALSLTTPMLYWGDAPLSHKLAMGWNDGAIAAHQAYPNRFLVLCTLPMQYPDRAIDELNRASKLPGVRGVYMGTNIGGKDLDDPLFEPIWARINELDLPVFLHPNEPAGGERVKAYYLGNLLANPFDTAIAAVRLIFGGVLDRHPKLQINLAHGGGTFPIHLGRLDRAWHVRPEIVRLRLPQTPSAYLQRFTFDTIVHSKQIMEFVISEVGVDRVMIGTDYWAPLGYDRPVEFVDQLNLTTTQRNLILGGTAAKILKL
jgi:aminocarboxymuconate-semialdehyde decarboxylase